MFETKADVDELDIPERDRRSIELFVCGIRAQLEHQYRMGRIQGHSDRDNEQKELRVKYGR